jgi:glycogen phosphorylase
VRVTAHAPAISRKDTLSSHPTHEQGARLPDRLARLHDLAADLWWTWNPGAREVFRRIDYPLWRQTAHNPVLMLRQVSPEMLSLAAEDGRVLEIYDEAIDALERARGARDTWFQKTFPDSQGVIAYFSAEFALHQSLPIYAGGLGVLAGDHCKEASDLGIPLIGVGFMYPQGYFHQTVSPEGWQQESYERLNWADAPVEPAAQPDGKPCVVAVPLGNRSVLASVWRSASAG